MQTPRRSGVRRRPLHAALPPSMKKSSMPMLNRNMVRRYGSACALTSGVALTRRSSAGDAKYPTGAMMPTARIDRNQERLIDRAIDSLVIVGSGEARDEHAHAGEERRDEDDDDEEDLPAHADRGVGGVADEVPDHRVVDDPLQPADRVLQDRRPRQLPHGAGDGTFDDRAIEAAAATSARRGRWRRRCTGRHGCGGSSGRFSSR